MASSVTLSAAVRSNLLSLANTEQLIGRTQERLASGLRVASPVDDARLFFQAKVLNDRARDFNEKKELIDQGISSISAALEAVEAIDSITQQLKGLANASKSATGTELSSIVTQYNELLTQVDNLAADTSYQGLNLVNGTGQTLSVSFSTNTASVLDVTSVDLTTGSLGLDISAAANFSVVANIDAAMLELDTALVTLRGDASSLGSNVALLETRLDFTEKYINDLEQGAAKLTLADITEEGANLVALQTRQQLGISTLSFAAQSEQSILALFR
jgi:flagellin-like hook-associated protein FlgL